MGRRRKYFTEEDRQKANNEKVKQFYWRNKDKLDEKAKAYYWRKKIENLIKEGDIQKAEAVREKAIKKGIEKELLIVEKHDDKQ
jgi:hypothetical protein